MSKSINFEKNWLGYTLIGLGLSTLTAFMFISLPLSHYLLAIGGGLFFILIYQRIEFGIGLLIASMLFEKPILPGEIELSLTRLLSLPVLSIALVKILTDRPKFHLAKFKDGMIILLFVWMMFSLIYAENMQMVVESLLTHLQLILTYFILKTVIVDDKQLEKVLATFVIAAMGIALLSMIPLLNNPEPLLYSEAIGSSERVTGTSYGPNQFAFGLVVLLPIALYLSLSKHKLYFIAVALFVFLILSTFSRGGILGLVIVVLLSLLHLRRSIKKSLLYGGTILVILASSFMLLNTGSKLTERIESIPKLEDVATRLELLEVAWEMGTGNPVLGVGLNNFREHSHLYGNQTHFGRDAHNGYLEVFAMLGLPGLILLIGILYSTFREINRYQKKFPDNSIANFIKIAFIGYLITAFFLSLLPQKIFWALLALTSILDKTQQSNSVED
ncbi:hypothetical protein GWO09_12960 [candidate division KSB1 bacterium]|nr:hypothetical protein [candidate division KSB1 bacterium]